MKEKIRQFARESGLDIYGLGKARAKWEDTMTKFAELMVRECVGIVAKRKDQAIDDSWNVDEAMSMAEMDLLEHFGVKE